MLSCDKGSCCNGSAVDSGFLCYGGILSEGRSIDDGTVCVVGITVRISCSDLHGAGRRESFELFSTAVSFHLLLGFQFPAFGNIVAMDVAVCAVFFLFVIQL